MIRANKATIGCATHDLPWLVFTSGIYGTIGIEAVRDILIASFLIEPLSPWRRSVSEAIFRRRLTMIHIISIHPRRRGFRHHFRVVVGGAGHLRGDAEVSVFVNEEELYNYHRFQLASLT